jgi:hypothetical protein
MNQEQIKEIVETIKTLNININDETTQKLADAVIPIVKMYIIKDYIDMVLGYAIFLVAIFVIYKIVQLVLTEKDAGSNN